MDAIDFVFQIGGDVLAVLVSPDVPVDASPIVLPKGRPVYSVDASPIRSLIGKPVHELSGGDPIVYTDPNGNEYQAFIGEVIRRQIGNTN